MECYARADSLRDLQPSAAGKIIRRSDKTAAIICSTAPIPTSTTAGRGKVGTEGESLGFWHGLMDEVTFYHGALTREQATTEYNSSKPEFQGNGRPHRMASSVAATRYL